MRLNADLVTSLFTISLGLLFYAVTRDLSRLGAVFVDYVLGALAVLSAIVFVKGLIRPELVEFFESAVERNNVLVGVAILLLYLILLPLAGFLPASYLFYFVFNTYLAGQERLATRNLFQSMAISAVVVTSFYLIFHHLLGVPLPDGSWLASG